MKKLLIILAVFISFTAFSQQKELTLSDAVLSYANGLNPKNLQNLQWVNGTTNYIYLEGNEYNIKTAAGKIVMKVGLEKFKSTFPELKRVPSIIAISATEMVFENENQIVHFDYRKGTVINKIVVDENAENKDYNYNQTALAFT
ncbi:MAG: hypothetical protein CO118_02605, partial [Flavobacteriales bacterium CG_4_9_14_3_um_filter_32_8]